MFARAKRETGDVEGGKHARPIQKWFDKKKTLTPGSWETRNGEIFVKKKGPWSRHYPQKKGGVTGVRLASNLVILQLGGQREFREDREESCEGLRAKGRPTVGRNLKEGASVLPIPSLGSLGPRTSHRAQSLPKHPHSLRGNYQINA